MQYSSVLDCKQSFLLSITIQNPLSPAVARSVSNHTRNACEAPQALRSQED